MRLQLREGERLLSQNTVLFTAPKFIDLPQEKIRTTVKKISDNRFTLIFSGTSFQHQVAFHLPGSRYRTSDNFFDLFPGYPHEVNLTMENGINQSAAQVKRNLQVMSVADTY